MHSLARKIRKNKNKKDKDNVYHIWINNDTRCRMHSTGGMGDPGNIKLEHLWTTPIKFKQMRKNEEICKNCIGTYDNNKKVSKDTTIEKESREFLDEDLT